MKRITHDTRWFLVALVTVTWFLAPARVLAQQSAPGDVYIIQPNDVLTVHVYLEDSLTRQVRVRPDGRISIPLVQDVQAAGRTPAELKAVVEEELVEWLRDPPEVTILIDEFQPYRVFVQGQVNSPGGAIASPEPLTVIQALAQAGGFLEYADTDKIRVIRRAGTTTQVFNFHYDDFIEGRSLSQNIVLQSGDTVVVP